MIEFMELLLQRKLQQWEKDIVVKMSSHLRMPSIRVVRRDGTHIPGPTYTPTTTRRPRDGDL